MAISTIVAAGFGSWGGVEYLPTFGFSSGVPVVPTGHVWLRDLTDTTLDDPATLTDPTLRDFGDSFS